MILENGLVRTMDAQLPTQRALAIAGERIAGGVGVHETALASPEVVDLGGRVVLPGFTDSHVHFPTWALAQSDVALDGCLSLDEALARVRNAGGRALGGVIRGYGWRSGDWAGAEEPTAARLDEVTGSTPAALIAKDYHSLWLNSAALALANGDLEVEGGVVERDAGGEPTGVLREEAAWRFKARYLVVPDDVYVEAMRAGLKIAASRGVTSVHDKDGWLGALRLWRRLEQAGALTLRVWQSIPADQADAARSLGVSSGLGSGLLRIGYLKAFMDGTLGSGTALMLDGSGVRITSGDELEQIVLARRRGRVPGGGARDRRRGEPRGARRVRTDARRRGRRSACGTVSSTRSCSLPRTCRGSPRSGSLARCSSHMRLPIGISPIARGRRRSTEPTPTGRCSSPALWWRTARMRRSRSSTRLPVCARAFGGRSTRGRRGTPSRR